MISFSPQQNSNKPVFLLLSSKNFKWPGIAEFCSDVWRSDASASALAKSGLVATTLDVYVYCNNLSFIYLRNGRQG